MKEEKTYYGVIVLFYKGRGEGRGFLVVENSKTGNVTFVSGTQEAEDRDLLATAQREIKEELGLDSNSYQLEPTDVYHNFVYGSKKPERTGRRGSNQLFLVNASALGEIGHTSELKRVMWLSKEEVGQKLTFSDLKKVFEQAVKERKW